MRIDVRFVGAVQADSLSAVSDQPVRSDLLFRLSGVVIEIPSLGERPEDVVPLAEYFADRMGCGLGDGVPLALSRVRWSGNVRELRLTIERAAA